MDDSALERRILGDALRQEGYDIKEFADGRDVLASLREGSEPDPDMVLLDAMMPGLDGFATCEAVKGMWKNRSVPVVMITAREDAASIDRAFDCGADDYVVKPVNMALLCRRIEMIVKARRADEMIRMMAYHDSLTGLPNRRLFESELSRLMTRKGSDGNALAIVFLDLDRFKLVNDRMGHAAGDQLLVEMARRFRQAVRSTDFVARLGGDEFMMILPQVDGLQSLLPVISPVFAACDRPVPVEGVDARIGVSVGVSFYPRDGEDINGLMKKADFALYQSKEKNGNTFTCFSGCN